MSNTSLVQVPQVLAGGPSELQNLRLHKLTQHLQNQSHPTIKLCGCFLECNSFFS